MLFPRFIGCVVESMRTFASVPAFVTVDPTSLPKVKAVLGL